uniref:C-type lectin domain-containing protein n=1 Tax=Erpetoichthys calabaricus TaxID=27687 RepID=A0A8C4TA14_ERPCA
MASDTLQSQYTDLNKKHEELAKEFSKLQEYYLDGGLLGHLIPHLSFALFVSFYTVNTCPLCKVGWIPFGSKCYFISITTLTWNESRDWCLTKGGQLVNVESLQEWHTDTLFVLDITAICSGDTRIDTVALFIIKAGDTMTVLSVHYIYKGTLRPVYVKAKKDIKCVLF